MLFTSGAYRTRRMHFNVFYRFAFYIAWKSAWSFPTTHSKLFKRIKRNRLIYFSHPLLISEGSRGTAALGGLEICHGFQQPFTTPLAAHQDGSNQGRWYNHATLSKVDLKAAFPCPWQRERALLVFRGAFCSPDPTTAPGISQLGELALHSRSNEFQSCALRRQVSQRRFFTITNLCRLLGLHHFQGRNEIRRRPGQWASLAPPTFEPEVFRKQTYCIEESVCDIFETFRGPMQWFGAPRSDSAPGELCPLCTPRYAPDSFGHYPRFLTTGEDRSKDRFKNWQYCSGWRFPSSRNSRRFTKPYVNLPVPPSFTREYYARHLNVSTYCGLFLLSHGRRQGGKVGVKPSPWAWYFTKLSYLRKGHCFRILFAC